MATEQFGRQGFEYSKWADVAAAVGVGSTALYHYFESKLHCLYSIMAEALEAQRAQFGELTQGTGTSSKPSRPSCAPATTSLNRRSSATASWSPSSCWSASRGPPSVRRRPAGRPALATRDLEFDWANFLSRGMAQGAIPDADPRLVTRAVLGLHNSVWHWYRPGGNLSLADLSDFYVERCLRVLGVGHGSPGK